MKKTSILAVSLLVCWLVAASLAFGTSVVVSQVETGRVILIDELGIKKTLASGLDRPSMVKYDKSGNLFVFENGSLRVSKVDPAGNITTFIDDLPRVVLDEIGREVELSYLDLTISDNERVFLLVRVYDFSGSPHLTEVWELVQDTKPTVIASFIGNTYRFTFGPGGHLYLAANGDSQYESPFNDPRNYIIRVSLNGEVSFFYEFPLPNLHNDPTNGANLMSVRFGANGEMFILTHNNTEGPNYRYIWKVQDGVASLFAHLGNNPGNGASGALTMTIDAEDNLFLVGGGSQCCPAEDGFIQKVDPLGNVTTVALFSNTGLNAMFYIDDDDFDSYPLPVPRKVDIDINPWLPNIISLKPSWGFISVAILSTKDFNAPSQVDPSFLTFGPTGDEDSLAFCYYWSIYANKDSYRDLVCIFYKRNTGFQCGDTEGILKGKTKDGTPIEGRGSVKIIPCR